MPLRSVVSKISSRIMDEPLETGTAPFGLAIEAIREGKSVKRVSWSDDQAIDIRNLSDYQPTTDEMLAEDWITVLI